FQRPQDIFRFAGSRQANQQVAGHTKRRNLAREDFVETVIVPRRGEKSTVARETDRRIGGTIFGETDDQLRREMSSVGGAAAVAANEQFASLRYAIGNKIRRPRDFGFEFF